LSTASLEPEVKQAATPARAASLRLTEQARRELLAGSTDRALQDLSRAVSIDPGNPFEYYYLGRAYLTRHNYAQAATFFQRAELGLAGRPDWLGETLSFEGASDEQLGRTADAVNAYKRAIAVAPGNVRAQVGLGRLAPSVAVTELDQPAPADQPAGPPPDAPTPPPAPDEAPAPPPTGIRN
jgi:tetratricopeptide (TPR) repeat protein